MSTTILSRIGCATSARSFIVAPPLRRFRDHHHCVLKCAYVIPMSVRPAVHNSQLPANATDEPDPSTSPAIFTSIALRRTSERTMREGHRVLITLA